VNGEHVVSRVEEELNSATEPAMGRDTAVKIVLEIASAIVLVTHRNVQVNNEDRKRLDSSASHAECLLCTRMSSSHTFQNLALQQAPG